MTNLTIQIIRDFEPCYDPIKHLPEDWQGSLMDVLLMDKIPASDKIWLAVQPSLLSDKILRLFAVDCARKALDKISNPDPRSVEACNVAEKFAKGEATDEELAAAWTGAGESGSPAPR